MPLYVEHIPGTRPSPTLVFLHHGLGCVSLWRDFPARLCQATGCRGLLYDRQGHGQSPPLTATRGLDYLHREADVLGQILREHNVAAPVLIGHSDGGSIALLYAAQPGHHVHSIVSEAAHVFVEPVTRAGIRAAIAAYHAGMRQRLQRHHGHHTERLFWEWAGTWLDPCFDSWNITAEARRVSCPKLVIQGEGDEYGTPAQVEAIGGIPLLLSGCGHEPHTQQPDRVLDAIAAWIET